MSTAQKPRFQIHKLEERIAPSGCGGYQGHGESKGHSCGCSGGNTEVNVLNGSLNNNELAIGSYNFNGNEKSFNTNSFNQGGKTW